MDGREKYRRFKELLLQEPWRSREKLAERIHADMHEELSGTISDEDTWIRYVETTGSDSNDGKSSATAWKTLYYALSQKPKISKMSIICMGAGTFTETQQIRMPSGMGSLVIVGQWSEVYLKATLASAGDYVEYGTNSIEKFCELVVTEDGSEPITWDDALLDYWVEFIDNASLKYRMKIVAYTAGSKRLFVSGIAEPTAISAPQTIKIVKINTTISVTGPKASFIIDGTFAEWKESQSTFNVLPSGVILNAVELHSTNSSSSTLVSLINGACLIPMWVKLNHAGSSSSRKAIWAKKFSLVQSLPTFYLTDDSDLKALVDSRMGTNCRYSTTLYVKDGLISVSSGFVSYGSIYSRSATTLSVAVEEGGVIGSGDIVIPKTFTNECGNVICNGRIRLGDCIRGRYYSNTLLKTWVSGSIIGFSSTPNTSYGRVCLDEGMTTFIVQIAGMNLGDVSSFTSAVPLISVNKGADLHLTDTTIGAVTTNECPAASSLIKIDKGSNAYIEGSLTVYHSGPVAGANIPTILVDQESQFIQSTGNTTIVAGSGVRPAYPNGFITVDRGSRFRTVGNLSVTKTGTGASGHEVVAIDLSSVHVEGNIAVSSTQTGMSLVSTAGSRLIVDGTTTISTAGFALSCTDRAESMFKNTFTLSACGTNSPFCVWFGGKATFLGDVLAPTKDYGNGVAIYDLLEGAEIIFGTALTGGPGNNNNSTAGYGMKIKGFSKVALASQAGPTGTTGNMSLGCIAGATAYPTSGTAVSDIVGGSEGTSQMCTCYVV